MVSFKLSALREDKIIRRGIGSATATRPLVCACSPRHNGSHATSNPLHPTSKKLM